MFVLKASVWLQAIESFRPDIAATTRATWARRSIDAAFVRPGQAEFAIPSDSIDYAVMGAAQEAAFPSAWCRLMLAGAIWVPGAPCGASCPKTHRATPMWAMCCPPTAARRLWPRPDIYRKLNLDNELKQLFYN